MDQFGLEDGEEDEMLQYIIEQSLLESSRKRETVRASPTGDKMGNDLASSDISKIFSAIKQGNERLLRDLCVKLKDKFMQTDSRGWTPLHEAAVQSNEIILELTHKAAGPNSLDCRTLRGQTPLYLAVEQGLIENASFLMEHGAQPDCQDQDKDAPLFVAIRSGRADLVKLLLLRGSSVHQAGCHGRRPLHEAARVGNVELVKLLLEAGARPDPRSNYGFTPLALAAQGGHLEVAEILLRKGEALLDDGYDPNFMLHPWIRRNYDDERKSALFFAVSNNDMASAKLLLEAGAMPNQDPVKCLQVALRLGNYDLINLLLRYGANVNYYSRINATHFPSALQSAFKDEVILRMLCHYGYDVERCFDCPYGNSAHIPDDDFHIKSNVSLSVQFCEVITVNWLKHLSGSVVRVLMDYVDHVTFCSKLKVVLMEQKQWSDICRLQENTRCLQHLCRLRIRRCLGRLRLRSPTFMSFLPLPERLKDFILYREYDLLPKQRSSY
ncbi:PREDICTED: dynein heavy chain 12, axonemal-like [Cyprinodon variegatus]|uniref:dynein heavy chain 12, axonemal-like n=1 Tax=Cyprinodon variegatus TaxID=28743 RepID=UPI00074289D3|nr:PREDICTED: dynein heavy chain 12, axonemal-like [Cyprinodon variegatus]